MCCVDRLRSQPKLAIWHQPEKVLGTTAQYGFLQSKNELVNINGHGTILIQLGSMGIQCQYSRLEIGIREPCK